MSEWQVTLPDGSFENYTADRLFIGYGCLIFNDIKGKRSTPYAGFAPGTWTKVLRVDKEGLETIPTAVTPSETVPDEH